MTEARLRELQVILYETGERDFRELALKLGDPRYQKDPKKSRLEKEVFALLGKLIDGGSFYMLKIADCNIKKIRDKLVVNGGWIASSTCIENPSNERYSNNCFPEDYIEGKRMYYLERDETGYHVSTEEPKPFSTYYFARETELKFAKERKKELEILHQAYLVKENIMSGNYIVDPKYSDLAELICEFFGYEKQIQKVPTK